MLTYKDRQIKLDHAYFMQRRVLSIKTGTYYHIFYKKTWKKYLIMQLLKKTD